MQRIEGETIARKILRDDEFAQGESDTGAATGQESIAGIHGLPRPNCRSFAR